MQCPNCQHWNEAGSRFCEECGIQLPENASSIRKVTVNANESIEEIANIELPQQTLIPIDNAVPTTTYTGPRLILNSSGSIFKLNNATVIGREDPTINIDLDGYPDGKYVSQRHAQVIMMNGKYYVEDLGSSNNTWVNNIKLAQGQAEPVQDGDVIRVGKIELTFYKS